MKSKGSYKQFIYYSKDHPLFYFGWRSDLQYQGRNEVRLGVTQPYIAFGKVSSSSVKRKISAKLDNIVPSHTREVDDETSS